MGIGRRAFARAAGFQVPARYYKPFFASGRRWWPP